jgi:hypothetical protein
MTHRIFAMPFSRVYPLYLAKVARKGRNPADVDQIIFWLTGYDTAGLATVLAQEVDFNAFFANAPALNPARGQIMGVICGHRIEQIPDPLMRDIRILDKMIDDLAKGRPMAKILRD